MTTICFMCVVEEITFQGHLVQIQTCMNISCMSTILHVQAHLSIVILSGSLGHPMQTPHTTTHTHTKATCEALTKGGTLTKGEVLTKGEALTKDSTSPQAHSTSFLFCNCVPNPFCQGIVAANPYFCQGNAFCKNSHPHFLLSRKMGG